MSTREVVDIDSCEDSDSDSTSSYTGAMAVTMSSSTSYEESSSRCHFSDAGWKPIREKHAKEEEEIHRGTIPPTPFQMQMAEETVGRTAQGKKLKIPLFSKHNVRKKHDGGGSSEEGIEEDDLVLNMSKKFYKLKKLGFSKNSDTNDNSEQNSAVTGSLTLPVSNYFTQDKTRQKQEQLWFAPPSNTVHVKCHHGSDKSTSIYSQKSGLPEGEDPSPYALPDDSIDNSFRPLLLIASKRKAHQGSIFVMKFSPHGGHYLATGGEDGKVCIWQVAPDQSGKSNSSIASVTVSDKPLNNVTKTDIDASPERFVAGAQEREEAVEEIVSHLRTTVDTLVEDVIVEVDPDLLIHEGGSMPLGTDINLLSEEPVAIFKDHKAEIIDLAWSQQPPPFVPTNNETRRKKKKQHEPFLLTASLDKTVRLWHMSRSEAPLHIFQHADMVTCVDFHPIDDSYFISGGFDCKLRLWSIPNGRVKEYAHCPDIITAAKFTPDGNTIAAGLMKGQVYFYMTEGMKYYTQISSKNRRGKLSDGRKVTGLDFFRINPQLPSNFAVNGMSKILAATHLNHSGSARLPDQSVGPVGDVSLSKDLLLVTTNDSRLRMYDMDGYGAIQKFKGIKNDQRQIKAHFCESGNFVICGSESGHVHIWENHSTQTQSNAGVKVKSMSHKGIADRSAVYASFEGCKKRQDKDTLDEDQDKGTITDAIFAPAQVVKDAMLACDLFCTTLNYSAMERIPYDFSSAVIVAGDDEGTLRVFMKRSCLDTVARASGPEGRIHGTP